MPRLSDSMSEATIVAWLKQPGETFHRGEPLVEVETDKATVVYQAEADGLLAEILVSEGVAALLGEPIARLGGDDRDEPATRIEEPEAPTETAKGVLEPVPIATEPAPASRARATPVARRTAVQLGVALHGLTGTGPGGRIRQLDVVRAGSSTPPSATRDLVARARARRLTPEELTASTFTVSNLGMFDVRSFTAVINAPQVAILAVGALVRAPVETAAGGVAFRDVATLTLTSDHRAVYGADAARFLGRIRQLLEHPLALVL